MSTIRVGIDANIRPDGDPGGVQQYIIGLVQGLSMRQRDDVDIVLITHPNDSTWLDPYRNEQMKVVPRNQRLIDRIDEILEPVRPFVKPIARPVLEPLLNLGGPKVPDDTAFFSELDLDVIHFPTQRFVDSNVPAIYNPHDLQHLHFPEFFTEGQTQYREKIYRAGCERSGQVCVASDWIKDDIVDNYSIDPKKVTVIPTAPPTDAYVEVTQSDINTARDAFNLPEKFGFYPAKTWPHKNHKRLVEAVGRLRTEHGIDIPIVLTGKKTEHWKEVRDTINEWNVEDLVHHLGFVTETEMRCLYRMSTFTIIPTLFEAASLPMFEAWREGSPVASSNVTSLPAIAGDAAALFDPEEVGKIAESMKALATDEQKRQALAQAGQKRGSQFTWEKTAERYLDVYRAVAEGNFDQISDSEVPIRLEEEEALL